MAHRSFRGVGWLLQVSNLTTLQYLGLTTQPFAGQHLLSRNTDYCQGLQQVNGPHKSDCHRLSHLPRNLTYAMGTYIRSQR